ncbi:MAG: hypothetical protein OXB84_07300 [Halobacteriovoraceae bacterium]|nr:hypothetical protein [Halobacteriovoraceae bacterium]
MTDIELLQNEINPQVRGVFWISGKKLINYPRPFHALDYFLDGLLFNYCVFKFNNLSTRAEYENKNFFVSSNFGSPFFVAHVDVLQNRPREVLDELMALARSSKNQGGSCLVLDFSQQDFHKYLSSKYKNFKFKKLDLVS